MSYNITSFKLKNLALALPLTFDFQAWLASQPESAGVRWCRDDGEGIQANLARNTWTLPLSGHELAGNIEGDKLVVTGLECYGEGSGHIYSDVVLPLFEDFKGSLQAIVVWEGGDTVNRLTIEDGNAKEEEID